MNIQKILKCVFFTPGAKHRWGLPLLLEGPPGGAKTALSEEAIRSGGLLCEVIIGSLREPSDFLGLPFPDQGRTRYLLPTWAAKVAEAQRAVVFFDEINSAAPSVQSALLRVVLDGAVGECTLPPTVRFIAAMNPVEQAAGGYDLAPPLANRFGHIKMETVSVDAWSDWLLGAGGNGDNAQKPLDAEAEEKRVLAAWAGPFAKASGLVTGFLKARPGLLHQMPKEGDPSASRAWPSLRTWEMATRALASAEVHGLDGSDTEELIGAFIGIPVAAEFYQWRKNADLPNPEDVLDGKVKFEPDPKRLDIAMAVYSSCSALVCQPKCDKKTARVSKLWNLLEDTVKAERADLVVPAARALVRARLSGTAESRPVMKRLHPILVAAGMASAL
jgi:hypothetical protein